MDYEAIAARYGAKDQSSDGGQVDYDAIAAKYGAKDSAPHMGAMGIPEAAANIVTGMGASAVGGLVGAGTFLGGMANGESAGNALDAASRNLQGIQDKFTYQPRSVEGKAISHIAGLPFEYATKAGQWVGETVGKPFGLEDEGSLVGGLSAGAAMTLLGGRSAYKNAGKIVPAAQAAFEAAKREAKTLRTPDAPIQYAPSKMAELATDSGNNAGRIEAAQAAQRLGIKLNPSESNPSKGNNIVSEMAGNQETNAQLSIGNKMTWTGAAKQELGIADGLPLSIENMKAGRETAGRPYQEMKAIPNMATGADVQNAFSGLLARDGMTPAVADYVYKDVRPLVEKIATASEGGLNGADIVNMSRKLRKDANTVYKQEAPEVGAVALADARMAMSKSLEDIAAKRLAAMETEFPGKGYGDLAKRFAEARTYIAKSHVVENATNADTMILDPKKVAKVTAKDNAVTGVLADIGKVANNFPNVSKINAQATPVQTHIYRTGIPAVVGGSLGFIAGMPYEGAALGGAAGLLGSSMLKKLIASEGYQAKNAIPQDFRPAKQVKPAPEGIIPWESPGSIPTTSKIELAPEPSGLDYGNFAQEYRAQKAMEAGAPEGFINREQSANTMREWYRDRSREIASQANRKPSGEGMPFDLDPITGRLVAADRGLKGATPDAIRSGHDQSLLSSAADKVASGRNFAMSALEMDEWKLSKVHLAKPDLTKAAPEFRGLSDAAIAEKVANRQWVDNRIKELKTEYADWAASAGERFRKEQAAKINEKANNPAVMSGAERQMRKLMNAEAARRMELNQETRRAAMQANIDALESMSDSLSSPRPSIDLGIGQGPKTRAHLRDLLQ